MNYLNDEFYDDPEHAHMTIISKQLKETLLHTEGVILVHGRMWNIVSKHLGVGVYKVSLERMFND